MSAQKPFGRSQGVVVKHVGQKPGGMSSEVWGAELAKRERCILRETEMMARINVVRVPGAVPIVATININGSPAIVLKHAGSM